MSKTEEPATINRPYPMSMENERFFLKKKGWGNRLIYEVQEKRGSDSKVLGTCRVFWRKESNKKTIPIAKVLVSKDKKLENLLSYISKLIQEQVVWHGGSSTGIVE